MMALTSCTGTRLSRPDSTMVEPGGSSEGHMFTCEWVQQVQRAGGSHQLRAVGGTADRWH